MTFTQKSHLNRHINIHTKTKRFICKICLRRFIQSGNLKTHMQTHNKSQNVLKNNKINLIITLNTLLCFTILGNLNTTFNTKVIILKTIVKNLKDNAIISRPLLF